MCGQYEYFLLLVFKGSFLFFFSTYVFFSIKDSRKLLAAGVGGGGARL